MNKHRTCAAAAASFALSMISATGAQVLGPAFSSNYSLTVLGPAGDVPANYGFIIIRPEDTDHIIVGGASNSNIGLAYSVPVIRGAGGHITGFGSKATVFGEAPNNDGGCTYMPNGAFLFRRYPSGDIGQWAPGSPTLANVINTQALGVFGAGGGLVLVPPGQPGEGKLKLFTYTFGSWHDLAFAEQADHTYAVTAATLRVSINTGPEGFVYVPRCSPNFTEPSILVCEYGRNRVAAYRVDDQGDPVDGTARDFVTGLSGAEGALIDPVTGDFIFGTFGSGNTLVRVIGFPSSDRCKADVNQDCFLNGDDYDSYVLSFENGDPAADYNEDGFVTGDDFDLFVNDFVKGC